MNIAEKAADNIRVLSLAMVEEASSGHPGGAMGGSEFIHVLFSKYLRYNPEDGAWKKRDRFFLDPGHMSPMLYAVLHLSGFLSKEDLKAFRQWGSITSGHPERDLTRGIENTSGPLGQGHVMAIGAAIAERFLAERFGEWTSHKTFTYISDGGIQEEISQGGGRIAGYLGLYNLVMYYDANQVQLSTTVDEVTTEDTAAKYKAWGWSVLTVDGNDIDAIDKALAKSVDEKERPTLIIGKTTMARKVIATDGSSLEGAVSTHGQPLSKAGADIRQTVLNCGGNPDDLFETYSEVKSHYAARHKELRQYVTECNEVEKNWREDNPSLASKWEAFFTEEPPVFDFESFEQNENIATREASAKVLGAFAQKIENMLVMSADLANSDKTDGFLKNTTPLSHHNYQGAFLHAGVCELTMATIANGMAAHGGIIPVCGTFFVFSDYMKPAVRMACLMRLPVVYVWTHDAFRVGEDGPTHQPIEHEAQIRLMEQVKNHSGQNSMLVLRPADANETTMAWQMALENRKTPTGLILTRQNVESIPPLAQYDMTQNAQNGGYVILETEKRADVTLLGSGSEVSTLFNVAKLLAQENISARVVSLISDGLFSNMPLPYQEEVIPSNIPCFGLTAGLDITLRHRVGTNGMVWGVNHFGYSAPAKVLDEKFGFLEEQVAEKVKKFLNKK